MHPFAYIACGTWSLVGVELDHAVLTEESRLANFTNEGGVDDRIRYLRNVMGLWLLQESLRTWELEGTPEHLPRLLIAAAELPPGGPTVDPDDPSFLPPGDMPARIADACARRDQPAPATRAGARSVHPRQPGRAPTVAPSVTPPGCRVRPSRSSTSSVAGARNTLLCQLTADACERPGARRPGRGDGARQRPRPGPRARPPGWRPGDAAGTGPERPRTSAATSRGRPLARGTGPEPDARRAVHHLLQRPASSRRSAGRSFALLAAARPRRRVPGRADVLRPDALQLGLPGRLHPAGRAVRRRVRGLRRRRHAVGLVRGDGPPLPPARRRAGGAGRRRDATLARPRGGGLAAGPRADASSSSTSLGVTDVGARFPHTVAFHPTCHSTRLLGRGRPADAAAGRRSTG